MRGENLDVFYPFGNVQFSGSMWNATGVRSSQLSMVGEKPIWLAFRASGRMQLSSPLPIRKSS